LSGLEAMEKLSALPTQHSGPSTQDSLPPAIIVMTAHGTMEAAIDAMRQGAYDYLIKPIALDPAAQLVDRLMEPRNARRNPPHQRRRAARDAYRVRVVRL